MTTQHDNLLSELTGLDIEEIDDYAKTVKDDDDALINEASDEDLDDAARQEKSHNGRTFLSDEAFFDIKASYQAKHDNGNVRHFCPASFSTSTVILIVCIFRYF